MRHSRVPHAGHPITISPAPGAMRAVFGSRVLVESARALVLREASYPVVIYFPREDADMEALGRSDRLTWCPYKGEARYFSVAGAPGGDNLAWSYESPSAAVAAIAGHLAFYADRVTVEPSWSGGKPRAGGREA